MAQTENGQLIYNYFAKADALEFGSSWTDFTIYMNAFHKNTTNYTAQWHKWCDEFAVWVLSSNFFEEGEFGLVAPITFREWLQGDHEAIENRWEAMNNQQKTEQVYSMHDWENKIPDCKHMGGTQPCLHAPVNKDGKVALCNGQWLSDLQMTIADWSDWLDLD